MPYYDPETNTHGGGGGLIGYEKAQQSAIDAGYLRAESPVDAHGAPDSGWVTVTITAKGKSALYDANKERGEKATRLVSKVRHFWPLKSVVYGHLFQVPLSARVKIVNHSVVVDDA